MSSMTLSAILASQASLLQEASEALPHQFSQCTYPLGYIRQAVYLCKTCALPRGICSACSIACHGDHEQLELFPKRRFRCDCPTSALPHSCTLHQHPEEQNTLNTYGQNFHGVFCRCGREYDAQTECETMIQCLACEDWSHESCLNLRERPSSREATPEVTEQPNQEPSSHADGLETDEANDDDDAHSEASSSGLPPPLIPASTYESFVCGSCVRRIDILRRYAGTPGVLMVVRNSVLEPWRVIGQSSDEAEPVDVDVKDEDASIAGVKRARSDSPSLDGPQSKRTRASPGTNGLSKQEDVKDQKAPSTSSAAPCLAPPLNLVAQRVLASTLPIKGSSGKAEADEDLLGTGDIFLTDNFRERWCRCSNCAHSLDTNSYLLEEEDTYEPPEDPDSGLSLEELGLRALARIPRERAIDGIHAFNQLRDQLLKHLRPIAEQGREVTEADINSFFEEARQGQGQNTKQ